MKQGTTLQGVFKRTKGELQIRKAYVIAFTFLLIACLLTLYMNRRMVHQSGRVEHSNLVVRKLETMLSKIKDGEGGVRGYLISGDRDFLEPYHGSYEAADSIYEELKELVADNPSQQALLDPLQQWMDERARISRFNIAEFESH